MFIETKPEKIRQKFLNTEPIADMGEAIAKLTPHPLKNTEQFLRMSGTVAWIAVDVFSREVDAHDHTNHYEVDLVLARRLVAEAIVNDKGELISQGAAT